MYSAWQSLPWCCKTVCRLFHQRSSICTLCCHTYSGGGQPVRMGMYPDIRSDGVLHSDPGRYEYRRPSVPFCRCRTAFCLASVSFTLFLSARCRTTVSWYDKNSTFFQVDFEIPGHFTSFRKPSAACRLFQCFENDKIKFYSKR